VDPVQRPDGGVGGGGRPPFGRAGPHGLTVLAPLRPGEAERLRVVLRAIGDDIDGRRIGAARRPHIDFPRSRTIHFARFAILDDPDRGAPHQRLLFSSNYDGELDDHLAELVRLTSDMAAIWGACEGYSGPEAFAAFIRAHAHQPAAFYIAFPEADAAGISHAIDVRRQALAIAHASPLTAFERLRAAFSTGPGSLVPRALIDGVRRLARALPLPLDLARAVASSGFPAVYRATLKLIASLDRYPVFRLVNRVTSNRLPPRQSPYSSIEVDSCAPWAPRVPGDEIPSTLRATPPTFREDAVTQNQLTLVTVVDPRQVARVRAVMAAIDSYAKRLAPRGSLIGISTIHFVRWLLIDEGRRLMMLSDYDGSWESYIDEFAEMILSGLDAIWESSFGFPPDGARDVPAFKRFLRSHQVPSEIFYSSYPTATVLNVAEDLRLAQALTDDDEHAVKTWLERH
jgi:hypothetical protein